MLVVDDNLRSLIFGSQVEERLIGLILAKILETGQVRVGLAT